MGAFFAGWPPTYVKYSLRPTRLRLHAINGVQHPLHRQSLRSLPAQPRFARVVDECEREGYPVQPLRFPRPYHFNIPAPIDFCYSLVTRSRHGKETLRFLRPVLQIRGDAERGRRGRRRKLQDLCRPLLPAEEEPRSQEPSVCKETAERRGEKEVALANDRAKRGLKGRRREPHKLL